MYVSQIRIMGMLHIDKKEKEIWFILCLQKNVTQCQWQTLVNRKMQPAYGKNKFLS